MSKISAKVIERFSKEHKNISKIISSAIERDINEADTVVIVNDVLTRMLGYNKYTEITREFTIRGTYCDLAIQIDNDVIFLIEVKAIGVKLADKHVKQAVDYAANQGIDWVILTNGVAWRVYELKFEKPLGETLIFSFDFLDLNIRKKEDQNRLFILSREGIKRNAILEFGKYKQVVNKFYITAMLQDEVTLSVIKKHIRKMIPKYKVDDTEILNILNNGIIKQEISESEDLAIARKELNKQIRRDTKKKAPS